MNRSEIMAAFVQESRERFTIEYTPKHAVHQAARARGWKTFSDKHASDYVDPAKFVWVKLFPTLVEAISFAHDLCQRRADYWGIISIDREVFERDDWKCTRRWVVTETGVDDVRGVDVQEVVAA